MTAANGSDDSGRVPDDLGRWDWLTERLDQLRETGVSAVGPSRHISGRRSVIDRRGSSHADQLRIERLSGART